MGQLQDRMIEDLTLRGSAPGTTSVSAARAPFFLDAFAGRTLRACV